MPDKKGYIIHNLIEDKNYMLNIHPVIELPIVLQQGPEEEMFLDDLNYTIEEHFMNFAKEIDDQLIEERIAEIAAQGLIEETKIFRSKNNWLKYIPLNLLRTYFETDVDTNLFHEKVYGVLRIDLAKLIQNIVYIFGNIAYEEVWDKVLWMTYDVFQSVFYEAEQYYPLYEEENDILVPLWREAFSGDCLETYFYKVNKEARGKLVEIGAYLNCIVDGSRENLYLFSAEEIEKNKKMEKNKIKVLDDVEDIIQVVESIIESLEISLL